MLWLQEIKYKIGDIKDMLEQFYLVTEHKRPLLI